MNFVPLNSYKKLNEFNIRFRGQMAALPAGTPPPCDQDVYDEYQAKVILFEKEYGEYTAASASDQNLTNLKKPSEDKLRQLNSHFIQVFNFMVERGAAPASDRTLLGLTGAKGEVPYQGSQTALLAVAANLIKGEADRVALGRSPMANPAVAEIVAAKTSYETALARQDQQNRNLQKEAADVEQPAAALTEAVMEIANNIRYRLRKRPYSEVRDYLRSIGFQFTPDAGESFTSTATVAANSTFTLAEPALGPGTTVTLTLKTALPGPEGVFACKNTSGGCDSSGLQLTPNTPITATFEQLVGDGDLLQITNLSGVEVSVEVLVAG